MTGGGLVGDREVRLYNTLSRSVQPLEPLDGDTVRVYGCGPTIYDRAHIGNFRTFIVYDLLHRYLEWRGLDVRFVVNLTDVDDKTIQRARDAGVSLADYTTPYEEAFLADADALGMERFDAYPRATDHIGAMVGWVGRLEERGLAYRAEDGSVYFRIDAFPGYGKLSGARASDAPRASRIDADEYEKDDVRDFVLWKGTREGEEAVGASWPSPWGPGRPGWHLECSVMSIAALGETLDLHLGGEDLIFPHHENEIAQSEGATRKPFARHWMHVKHLLSEGRKMSKSLGNFYTIRELLEEGHEAASIRHQLLSAHYRRELNFTLDGLKASGSAVQRLLDFEDRLTAAGASEEGGKGAGAAADDPLHAAAARALDSFREALDDDLNSAEALSAVFVLVSEGNGILDRGEAGAAGTEAARATLTSIDRVLGLLSLARRDRALDVGTVQEIDRLVEERDAARAAKDWARADEIRDLLAARGVVLEDSAGGTRWKVAQAVPEDARRG